MLMPLLKGVRKVVVTSHISPDGDSVASMAALSSSLGLGRWEVLAVSPGPVPEVYRFVPGSEVIVVYPDEQDNSPEAVRVRQGIEEAEAIICLDAGDLSRMGAVYEEHRAKFESVPVAIIDHHTGNGQVGAVNVVDPSAAAACELLAILMEQEDLPITEPIATALLVGIVSDSLGFRISTTSPRTLRVAASLVERGAPLSLISEKVFNTRSLPSLRLWGQVLSRVREENGLVWSDITGDMLRESGATMEDADNLVDFMAGVQDARGAFLFSERDGQVKVSMRSFGELDVAALARAFGGGGHIRAAGCTLDASMGEAQERVLREAWSRLGVWKAS